MPQRFHDRFGTAGVIVAVIALVAALGGTTLAASGALTGKQKKEVEKIAKKFAGKPGVPGTAGANGTNGKDGTTGANGSNGAPGESVTITNIAAGGECGPGVTGTKFSNVTGSGKACNGKNGTTGFTETLPAGKTETGTFSAQAPEGGEVLVPISFTIPVEGEASITESHFIKQGGTPPPGCEGGTVKAPSAEPGNLCVFSGEGESNVSNVLIGNVNGSFEPPLGGPGSLMLVAMKEEGGGAGQDYGSWAVTAPTE